MQTANNDSHPRTYILKTTSVLTSYQSDACQCLVVCWNGTIVSVNPWVMNYFILHGEPSQPQRLDEKVSHGTGTITS